MATVNGTVNYEDRRSAEDRGLVYLATIGSPYETDHLVPAFEADPEARYLVRSLSGVMAAPWLYTLDAYCNSDTLRTIRMMECAVLYAYKHGEAEVEKLLAVAHLAGSNGAYEAVCAVFEADGVRQA